MYGVSLAEIMCGKVGEDRERALASSFGDFPERESFANFAFRCLISNSVGILDMMSVNGQRRKDVLILHLRTRDTGDTFLC